MLWQFNAKLIRTRSKLPTSGGSGSGVGRDGDRGRGWDAGGEHKARFPVRRTIKAQDQHCKLR